MVKDKTSLEKSTFPLESWGHFDTPRFDVPVAPETLPDASAYFDYVRQVVMYLRMQYA